MKIELFRPGDGMPRMITGGKNTRPSAVSITYTFNQWSAGNYHWRFIISFTAAQDTYESTGFVLYEEAFLSSAFYKEGSWTERTFNVKYGYFRRDCGIKSPAERYSRTIPLTTTYIFGMMNALAD